MVRYSIEAVEKLKKVIAGELAIVVTAETPEQFTEFVDEVEVLLIKLSRFGQPQVSMGNSTTMIIGNVGASDGIAANVNSLFDAIGITHTELPDDAIISRNNGFVYDITIGECLFHNKVLGKYVANDLTMYNAVGDPVPLASKYMSKFMPDLVAAQNKAKEDSGIPFEIGQKVRVKSYQQLKDEFGEAYLTVGPNGELEPRDVVVGNEPFRFIKTIIFQESAGAVYCGNEATIEGIDYVSGRVILNIDGRTEHNKFEINGKTMEQSGASVYFYVSMIESV